MMLDWSARQPAEEGERRLFASRAYGVLLLASHAHDGGRCHSDVKALGRADGSGSVKSMAPRCWPEPSVLQTMVPQTFRLKTCQERQST